MTESNAAAAPAKKRSGWGRVFDAGKLILGNFLLFAILVELVCVIYINVTNWHSSKPTYHVNYNNFWADINPDFGVWHRPNGHFYHQGGCFSVEYTTNGYGARDRERSLRSDKPRTVVLGDSMIEGLGLPDADRLTNILEKDMGREYLNFGTSGDFGPLQYAILYKTLAAKFDHDTVVVGVLPDNDFHDMSLDWGKKYHADRYRPYYADDFSIIYTNHVQPEAGEHFWDRVEAYLRAYLASYHVGQFLYSSMYWRTLPPYSGYNDFNDVDIARLWHALDDIQARAHRHHAQMAVILIPTSNDFYRLQKAGENRLGPVVQEWGKEKGIPVEDLLPEMAARSGGNYQQYFLRCDGHWSPKGSRVAAEVLEPWLRQIDAMPTKD